MFAQKASPIRSTKSGNSTTSSTNSVRSTASPKLSSGQTSRNVSASTVKARAPAVKSENTPQSSFDEEEDNAPVPDGLVRCGICKRNFAEDRIEKHQSVCQKMKSKKRKVYDASKKRVQVRKLMKRKDILNWLLDWIFNICHLQGTEAESFNRKPISAAARTVKTSTASKPSNNWRSKHEDFIKTIRAAKEMQAHLAKGGKLSDLPPPPPSENPDYVQCPHCSRRFNEAAAARHIPLCKNMQVSGVAVNIDWNYF